MEPTYDVRISQSIYVQATDAAKAERIPVEQFIEEAVRMRIQEDWQEPEELTLSAERLAKVRKAQAQIQGGMGLTMEQVEKNLADKKAAWLAQNAR